MPGLSAVLIPAALAAAVAGAVASQPFIAGLAGLAVVVMSASHIWARLSLEEIDYRRDVSPDHVFVGDELELTITIENRKPLPLPWLRALDLVPEGLTVQDAAVETVFHWEASGLGITTSLAWYERARFKYRLRAIRRGFYRLGPVRLESGDLFGVYSRGRQDRAAGPAVVVYPQTVPMDDFQFPSGRPIGEARMPVRIWEDPSLPSGLREYRPGDPVKRIDWKATARRAQPLVRTYDPSAAHQVVIVADLSTTDHPWEGIHWSLFERAITAAASVASRAFELGYRVRLVTNGVVAEKARTAPMSDAEFDQLAAVLETLAMVRAITVAPIERAIKGDQDAFPFGSTIVAISPMLQEGFRAKLAGLRERGHPVLVVFVGDSDAPEQPPGCEVRSMGEVFDLEAQERRSLFQPPSRRGRGEHVGAGTPGLPPSDGRGLDV